MSDVKHLIDVCGNEAYFLRGRLHRDNGPAYIYADGTLEWWQHGDLHRADGPAITYPDGKCSWWYRGKAVKVKQYYQMLTGKTDEEMLALILRYGGF